ncbi:hypothetical protein [Confluentibacter citreus]|uniref:hypothetical protein n=1 Tax=Confluentibacter citreus TaxID=2007307 RepID=UPI000C2952DB|nr:hypothetical protein [Confluentibacter citreus]
MIKKLVLVFIAILTLQSYAQQRGTASPYSFYGIGSLKFKGTVENRSMGGLSIYTDSIHLNLRNPASNATDNLGIYGGENRPVKYSIGGGHSSVGLKSSNGSDNSSSTSFDYIALSLPMGKFGLGFGLLPYTSVGYRLESVNENGDISNRFNGQGGLNKVYFGLGYLIKKGLSVGIDANYNFGSIQNSAIEFLYDTDGVPLLIQSRENNRSDLSGLNINLGLSYKTMLNKKLELVTGITFTPESNLTSNNERSFSTITVSSEGLESVNSTIDYDLDAIGLKETDLVLPSKFSIGVGIGEVRKWFVGAEFASQSTNKFYNALYSNNGTTYENGYSYSLGGFYIPDYDSYETSLSSYFKRWVYRGGLHYEKTGLNINNESINEFGISFGVGIPLGSMFSNANLGFEIGKRGTTNSNLIQENFINFQISLSLNDRWFEKSKYN